MKQYPFAVDKRAVVDAKRGWTIGKQPNKTAVTWHYNGPPVPSVEQWSDAQHERWIKNVIIPNHISRIGADGVQYHAYVLPNGAFWQLRDFDAVLWSTANWEGNGHSINIHVPIGGDQKPTRAQVVTLRKETDRIIEIFKMAGRQRTFGHQEWKGAATACPGPHLMAELIAFRAESGGSVWFEVKEDRTNVREGPGTSYPVALGGKAKLRKGDVFLADGITIGEKVGTDVTWAHRADGLGFIHTSLLRKVE